MSILFLYQTFLWSYFSLFFFFPFRPKIIINVWARPPAEKTAAALHHRSSAVQPWCWAEHKTKLLINGLQNMPFPNHGWQTFIQRQIQDDAWISEPLQMQWNGFVCRCDTANNKMCLLHLTHQQSDQRGNSSSRAATCGTVPCTVHLSGNWWIWTCDVQDSLLFI